MTLIQNLRQLRRHLFPPALPRPAARPEARAEQSGFIGPGPHLSVPFELKRRGAMQVVVFADPPGLVAVEIELADGTRLGLANAAEKGAVLAHRGSVVCCTLAAGGRIPAGRCRIHLEVDTKRFRDFLMQVRPAYPREFERLAASGIFYSVSAFACRAPVAKRRAAAPAELGPPAPANGASGAAVTAALRRLAGPAWAAVRPAL